MSDLKHQTLEELRISKYECEKYINRLSSQLSGQKARLDWIDKYIFEKSPQELSIEEIERRLGHRVILK